MENEEAVSRVFDNGDRVVDEDNDDELDEFDDDDDDGDDGDVQSLGLGTDDRPVPGQAALLSPEMQSALTKLASSLCANCKSLCRGDAKVLQQQKYSGPSWAGELEHHPSLSSLKESISGGCPLCKELERFSKGRFDMKSDDSWYITCRLDTAKCFSSILGTGLSFLFTFYHNHDHPAIPNDLMNLVGDICMYFSPAEALRPGPEYSEYTAEATNATSTPNISLAQHWLNRCLDNCNHRDKGRSKFLPTRLIEVWPQDGASSNIGARLCETKNISSDSSYLTLSHCWGPESKLVFTLKCENLETLKRNIPIHELPVLFKDALYITSQLGMTYLWIDSLCIIQDSESGTDWKYEAARMGDVYRYAECNIAASGYKDGKTSIFKERAPIPLQNFPICVNLELLGDPEIVGHTGRTLFEGMFMRVGLQEFYQAISSGPLNSRGWVAQERALSSGILHFTPKQMWWECKNHIVSESFPYVNFRNSSTRELGPNALRSLRENSDLQAIHLSWINFVSFYVGTNFTNESDRLPALTGIARAFEEVAPDNLIAGFWEKNLIQSLSWIILPQDRVQSIPSEQLLPSWSWTFLCTRHSYGYGTPLCVLRGILSDEPDFRSDLRYGSTLEKSHVQGIKITGLLRKLPVKAEQMLELLQLKDGVSPLSRVYYDVAEDGTNGRPWEETHILPLLGQIMRRVSCLLLNHVQEAKSPNTFRRVGVVNIWFEDDDSRDEFLGYGIGNGTSKPSAIFEEHDYQDLILI